MPKLIIYFVKRVNNALRQLRMSKLLIFDKAAIPTQPYLRHLRKSAAKFLKARSTDDVVPFRFRRNSVNFHTILH